MAGYFVKNILLELHPVGDCLLNLAALGVEVVVAAGLLHSRGSLDDGGRCAAVGVAHKILVGPFAGTEFFDDKTRGGFLDGMVVGLEDVAVVDCISIVIGTASITIIDTIKFVTEVVVILVGHIETVVRRIHGGPVF